MSGPLDSPDARRWRRELRDWLEVHAPRGLPGPDVLGTAEPHRAWERTLCDAGYAAIHWPAEYGGRDVDVTAQMVFQEEYDRVRAPVRVNVQGLLLAGPVLMRYGTRAQQERWLAPMLRCDEIWCQGFSEPGAGSDLGVLRTRGRIDGDELVVDGQKIWTSYAAWSDWIFALVRTDQHASKHGGITWVMIDLTTPGIEVRPLRQMNGGSDFAEVFFADVRVPLGNIVGGLGNGWKIAMSALTMERGPGRRSYVKYLHDLERLRGFVDARGLRDDAPLCEELGDLLGNTLAYRCYVDRVVDEKLATGESESTGINKLLWSEMQARMFDVGMTVLGDASELIDDADAPPGADAWRMEYWHSRASLIYAGTNQIQKNIIAERMLGLPRENSR